MKVEDIMTAPVCTVQGTEPIKSAAQAMADFDVGALPVLDGDRLVGIVTDRDIAVRAIAGGIAVERPVRLIMTEEVETCPGDLDVEDALAVMSYEQIRRLPVCDEDQKIIGMIALADLAHRDPDKWEVAEALSGICEANGLHCQPPVYA